MNSATNDPSRAGVCILTETFHPVTGGGETQARSLAEGLRANGHQVHLLTRRSDAAFAPRETVGGVPVHRLGPAGRGHLRKWGLVFTALVALVRLKKNYDVLLVCGFRVLGIPAMLVSLLYRVPCILKADSQGELSGAFFDPGLARMKLRHDRLPVSAVVSLRNTLLRRAAGFVAISEVIEQEYLVHGVRARSIVRIPNSVDAVRFRPVDAADKVALRARLGLPPRRRIVTFTGRLVTTKGLVPLLCAWQDVAAAHPDALLLLVGSGGLGLQNCEQQLRRHVSTHALENCVRFTGSVDNVHEYLQASDVFVFPTQREAFGISVIEAMACGLPIVTTGVDGIRDVVRPGVDALVVPAADQEALAAAMERALEGGDAIVAMAEAARSHALAHFSGEQVVRAYRELLERLVRR